MAKFFPDLENINRLVVPPTDGERHLLSVLRDMLDDAYEVYFNPFLDGDRPDLIVLKPGCGAMIIEVKDWNLRHFQINTNNRWCYQGKIIRSPQQQVFGYKENLFNLHLSVLGLEHLRNRNFYGIISVAVYFHRASRAQLSDIYDEPLGAIHKRIGELNGDFKHIDWEIYDRQVTQLERARFKLNRDLGMSWGADVVAQRVRKFAMTKESILFTSDILEDLRRRLRPPEHVLNQGIEVKFDQKQRALTVSKPGFAKIRGVAGSGKTTILAQRAINANERHKSQVLILTFNITLRHYIRDTISRLQGGGNQRHFEIIHYHAFIASQINNYGIDLESKLAHLSPAQRDDLDFVYGLKTLFADIETERYQTILIDEVQDYHAEWIKLVRGSFLAEDGEMILFGDLSQNIYGRPSSDRESPSVLGFGSWVSLTTPYRSDSNSPLLQLFREFQIQCLGRLPGDSEVPSVADAGGVQGNINLDLMSYELYGDTYDAAAIIAKVKRYISDYQLHPNDITLISSKVELLIPLNEVLSRVEKTMVMFEEEAEITALPRPVQENHTLLEVAIQEIRRRKKAFFMQNSGRIKLSTIQSFKGLEAQAVFCILTTGDQAEMVYTGITRAKRHLVIFDSPASRFRSFFEKHIAANA